MASGLLSLKWNNHRSTFFHELSTIRSKEAYNDVTIACDGNFYPLHKFVLSTCSDYFEEMFERTTCKNPIIVLKDIKCEELEALLNYMYVGEVNVVQEKLAGLIKAAECLKIKGLAVPDEDPENSRENANVSSREQNKRSQRNEGSPRAKKRRRDNTADVSEEILSPVNKIRTSNGRSRDSQSNRKSTSEEMSDNKPNNEEMENSSINANRLSESSSNKANSSSHKKDFEPEEVTLEDEPVKTEPIDLDNDESNDNAADNKDTLHEELGFDASDSMAGEEDNYVDVDPSMLGQGEEAMPGSSGFQGNSFPLWEGEGSLSNFPSEGFSGDGSSQARQMVADALLLDSQRRRGFKMMLNSTSSSATSDDVDDVSTSRRQRRLAFDPTSPFLMLQHQQALGLSSALDSASASALSKISSDVDEPGLIGLDSDDNVGISATDIVDNFEKNNNSDRGIKVRNLLLGSCLLPSLIANASTVFGNPGNDTTGGLSNDGADSMIANVAASGSSGQSFSAASVKLQTGGYACPYRPNCDKLFRDKTDLTRHIRTHTGETPYGCPLCSYRCKQKGSLKLHVNKVHYKAGLDSIQ